MSEGVHSVVFFLSDHNGAGAASANLLNVGDDLVVQHRAARGRHNHEYRQAFLYQGDRAVLELAGSKAFSVHISQFLELEGTL